jgi:hypothetical protein
LTASDRHFETSFTRLSPKYCLGSQEMLNNLNYCCDENDRVREQEHLMEQARQEALSKLTKAEIELLGIRYRKNS